MEQKRVADFQDQKKFLEKLFTCAYDGDLAGLTAVCKELHKSQKLQKSEIFSDFKDANQRTVLHFASAQNQQQIITYILEFSPSAINSQDSDGGTALLYATKENAVDAVQLLIKHGADVNLAKKNGVAPLHEAAANGNVQLCTLFKEHSANLEAMSMKNGTALHFAISEEQSKIVDLLLSFGANVNAQNNNKITLFILCVIMKQLTIARTLLQAGCDLHLKMMGGFTALHVAAETGYIDIIKELLSHHHADVVDVANSKSDSGLTPVQLAAGMGHTEVVEVLKPITNNFEDISVSSLVEQEEKRVQDEQDARDALKLEEEKNRVAADDALHKITQNLTEAELSTALNHKNEGNSYFVKKDYPKSISCYTKAIEISPGDGILYSNRSAAYLSSGDPQKGLDDILIAKRLKPNWAKASFREGQCYESLHLYEKAAYAFWDAIKLSPEDKKTSKEVSNLEKRFQDCIKKAKEDFHGNK